MGGPRVTCDLPEEERETGLGLALLRSYKFALVRAVFTIIPGCGNCREYLGGGHTDVGAHYYDFAQCALETDHSGLVEIIPLDDPVASTGVRYLYKMASK